jgi:molybdopterin converting factor small subunit
MADIVLAGSLTRFTNNQKKFQYDGNTLHDVLLLLCRKNLELSKFIYNESSELHPFVNIYIDNKNVRDLQGLETRLQAQNTVRILPGISGG